MNTYTIYTDGGCDPNPGPGGWGVVILQPGGSALELSGGDVDTTNNRMELQAAVEAFRALPEPAEVEIYTDSQYLMRGITEWLPTWVRKGWRTTNGKVANRDLWQALLTASSRHSVHWHWLRGHTGDRHNERADLLVKVGRRKALREGKHTPPPDEQKGLFE